MRMHLIDPERGSLPAVEGLLVSKRRREYLLALPSLILAPGASPAELEARWLTIPRERVAFYEVLA